jgi:predicted  nucleic acid-binding Zn-ribbon protein
MTKKQTPTDLIEQAKRLLSSWAQIDDQLMFAPLSTAALVMALKRANNLEDSITDLENKLTDLRNQRDASNLHLWNMVKRSRASFEGLYGDDSSQFEMVGGTRLSDRRTARRSAVPVQ